MNILLLFPIVFPFLAGLPLFFWKPSDKTRRVYLSCAVLLNSAVCWLLIANRAALPALTVLRFSENLPVSFHIDGLSCVFAGLVATLWPFATLYAFEYMEHFGERNNVFFGLYTMTFGVSGGIAFAENLLTLYFCYELLTLVTVPLVLFTLSKEAVRCGRQYLYYSLGGAAFAFIGLIFVISYGNGGGFALGGILDLAKIGDRVFLLRLIYVLAFCGFGVKAAIFPFQNWLPDASVAPVPVTALLHAVAVVKSGVFAILRLTYYCYGTEFLKGSFAQYAVMGIVLFTILFGSSMAVKEKHFKRRLAYCTVSNLSYVLFGATLMSPAGFAAALFHMIAHAASKICSFFCAGAVIERSGLEYVDQIGGLAKKMPLTFACLTASSLALMSIPPLAGFISKWNLAVAALESGDVIAVIGDSVLLISALLTAIYLLTVSVRAYFAQSTENLEKASDPGLCMSLPMVVFAALSVLLGLSSSHLFSIFTQIAAGVF